MPVCVCKFVFKRDPSIVSCKHNERLMLSFYKEIPNSLDLLIRLISWLFGIQVYNKWCFHYAGGSKKEISMISKLFSRD